MERQSVIGPGSLLVAPDGGAYELGEQIGHGPRSRSFEALGPDGEPCACKVLLERDLEPKHRPLIEAEAEIHGSLRHPLVLPFRRYFADGGAHCFVTELCEAGTLRDLLDRMRPVPYPYLAHLMRQLVEALRYVHGAGVLHRDVKPGNVFIGDDFGVRLADFDLATRIGEGIPRPRGLCGTPHFVAPEVAAGDEYGFEADVWSFGVVFYTAVFGRRPFDSRTYATSNSREDILRRVRECVASYEPRPKRVPEQAIKLLQSILVRDPARRPTLAQIAEHPALHPRGSGHNSA